MSEQQSNSGKSNAPKGHGPGTQTRPGANVCPAGAGKGIIGTVKGDPLKLLHKLGPELGFQYAVTGYVAANYIKETTFNAPPMVYLYALKKSQISFNEILMKLENIHNYISVLKKANLIILQPFQKEGVFIESKRIKGVNCVSPLQLYLDLHGLDRGSFVIEELNDHWQENGLFYEV